ncbi:MAG: SusC/RagA family TonB-linked outer membrane protein [Bacteroidota bacterium]|nr:SusC/RagA family TonB-linked outer membrane protein [Bacteroidota bacterium]
MKSLRKLLFLLSFLFLCFFARAQQKTVSGKVIDSDGNGIPGISVVVRGTRTGASTSNDGTYSLSVPSNATLVVSGVGFATREIPVEGKSVIDITLSRSQSELNAVVVTALGISKQERKLGYSVTTVDGGQLDKAKSTNVALNLAGQVSGLDVHGTNGGPGGSARILLRGMPSMNDAGSPLFVIDGVPMDNSSRGGAGEWGGADLGDGIGNINPDDIATMTVLKGQAASALYGARASNGVILITTKKGKKGGLAVEYNTNYSVDKAINNQDYQYVYGQGQYGAKPANATEARNTDRLSWGAKMDGSQVIGFDGNQYPYSPFKDNIKDFYRAGPTFTNTVSVGGGSDKGNFRLSASNLTNSSIIRNSGIDRNTVNLDLNHDVTDKLHVSLMANYVDEQDKNRPNLSDGPLNPNNFLFLASNVNENIFKPGYDASGSEIVFSDDNYVTNPWFVVNKAINNTGRKRLISAISGKYNFTNWLYAMVRLGYDHEDDRYFTVTPTGTNYSYNSAGQSGQLNNLSNAQTTDMNLDGIIGASHQLFKNLELDAILGGNIRKDKFESIGVNGNHFVIPELYTPGNVVSFGRSYTYSGKEVHSGYYSFDFNYMKYLTLSTTGRYDAYSTLYNSGIPQSQRNIFTPSVSASFIFSQLTNINKLNFGKLRVSYAQTSGEPVNPYQTAVYYSVGNAINGVPTGNFSNTLPNLFLKPFVKTELEIGTELKFYDNRLGFDIAYYSQKTKNEIMNGGLSSATGFTSTVIANGAVQNRGLEVRVTGTPIRESKFRWDVSFNLSSVENKILQTDAAGNNVNLGTYRPLNANTAFVKGLSGPQILAHDYTYDSKGDIVVDASGLPVQGKLIPMGSVLPTLYGGLNNSLDFGNFNLSFLIDYNYGNKILSATSYYSIYRGLNKMTLAGRETGITTGVTANGSPNTVAADAQNYYQRLATISRVNVLNGDYIKLRQLTFGYTITQKMLGNIPVINSIQLALVGRNLWTIMKKSPNIDPENGFSSTVRYAGIEGTSLPATTTFGINAKFIFKN